MLIFISSFKKLKMKQESFLTYSRGGGGKLSSYGFQRCCEEVLLLKRGRAIKLARRMKASQAEKLAHLQDRECALHSFLKVVL